MASFLPLQIYNFSKLNKIHNSSKSLNYPSLTFKPRMQRKYQFIANYNYMADQIIFQVGADQEESDGYAQLDEQFFLGLHYKEIRFVKLKHGRKTKESENQLKSLIINLVSGYTDCIDYFGAFGDAAVAYFQIKLKEVNKYFQFLSSQITHKQLAESPICIAKPNSKDLGSISGRTGTQLLPQEERQTSIASKEALNHSLMVYLQSQDITSHIKESMKKQKKIHNAITDSLKQQDDFLMKRKKDRDMSKSRVFLSFSENRLDFKGSPENSQNSEMIFTDLQALQINSPEELRALAFKLEYQISRAFKSNEKPSNT